LVGSCFVPILPAAFGAAPIAGGIVSRITGNLQGNISYPKTGYEPDLQSWVWIWIPVRICTKMLRIRHNRRHKSFGAAHVAGGVVSRVPINLQEEISFPEDEDKGRSPILKPGMGHTNMDPYQNV
jgi:hypothetical protein